MSKEIVEVLKLFIRSPNSVHNIGEERDKYVPNPKANSKTDVDNYYKFGIVLALCLKMNEVFNISLPSIFWKYLVGGSLGDYRRQTESEVGRHEDC